MPEGRSRRWKLGQLIVFGLLANLPDFPIKHWGHRRYDISHSVFVNTTMMLVVLLLLSLCEEVRTRVGGWPVIIGGSLAWLSHLLLDSFYNHGMGVAIFWPFSDARLVLPIAWYSVVADRPPPLTWETARILLVELVSYSTLLVLVVVLRKSRAIRLKKGNA